MENLTFVGAVKKCLVNYAKFSGRANRSEFWYFVLFTVLVGVVAGTLDGVFFPIPADQPLFSDQYMPFSDTTSILLLVPSIAVMVRRIRDTGRSAKTLYWFLLPLVLLGIGFLIALPVLLQLDVTDPTTFEAQLNQLDSVKDAEWLQRLGSAALFLAPGLISSIAVQVYFLVVLLKKTKPE
ncbi:MAG: hypothetical protein RIR16_895 [Actinomycetota bacterium]|jgi:uncharacterized membrane protein YhaH (DUF805 family)